MEGNQAHPDSQDDLEGPCDCITELSNDILSYERFYPGRILGNTFTIINKSDKTLKIEVDFTNEGIDRQTVTDRLLEFYEVTKVKDIEQPYQKFSQQEYVDSEKEFKCWFIEDPYKKTLVKRAEYELKPFDSFEFIIVLKSPVVKKAHFLLTNVRVVNMTNQQEHRVFGFGSLDIPRL